jgi:hypothetical protein
MVSLFVAVASCATIDDDDSASSPESETSALLGGDCDVGVHAPIKYSPTDVGGLAWAECPSGNVVLESRRCIQRTTAQGPVDEHCEYLTPNRWSDASGWILAPGSRGTYSYRTRVWARRADGRVERHYSAWVPLAF